MDDLYLELQRKTKELEVCVKQLRKNGSAKAQAEYDYQLLKAKEHMKLIDEGMPATTAKEIIRGVPSVAKARFDRDLSEVVYQANFEAINSIKLQLRLIENQLQREYSISGNGV